MRVNMPSGLLNRADPVHGEKLSASKFLDPTGQGVRDMRSDQVEIVKLARPMAQEPWYAWVVRAGCKPHKYRERPGFEEDNVGDRLVSVVFDNIDRLHSWQRD